MGFTANLWWFHQLLFWDQRTTARPRCPWARQRVGQSQPKHIQPLPPSSKMHRLPFITAFDPFIISDQNLSDFCRLTPSRSIPFPAAAHTRPPSLCFSPFLPKVDGCHHDSLSVVSVWREASYISHFSKAPSQWDGNLTWLLANLNDVVGTWLFPFLIWNGVYSL